LLNIDMDELKKLLAELLRNSQVYGI